MDESVFDDIRWQIEEADNRSLERFCKDTETDLEPDKIRERVEAYILERLDNVARVFLTEVRGRGDIERYVTTLRDWCDDILPGLESTFKPKLDEATLRIIEERLGTIEGRIIGSVHRGKLAGRIAHWKAEAISQARNAPAGNESRPKTIIARLPKAALIRVEAATAAFMAEYLPKLEREANKSGPIRDAELLRDFVTHQFNLVARECMAVCGSAQEFEAELHSDIARFVHCGLSQYRWLADPMRKELATGFALFVMRANPWAEIPEDERASVWHVGAITGEALTHAALKLRAEAWKHAEDGGFPEAKQAGAAEPSGNEPTRNGNGADCEPDGNGADRRAAVNAYIEEVFSRTGKRITKTDIWKSARYKSRTEFERWERQDRRATKTANERFTRILTEKPHLK
jgi:hypothetical protein